MRFILAIVAVLGVVTALLKGCEGGVKRNTLTTMYETEHMPLDCSLHKVYNFDHGYKEETYEYVSRAVDLKSAVHQTMEVDRPNQPVGSPPAAFGVSREWYDHGQSVGPSFMNDWEGLSDCRKL